MRLLEGKKLLARALSYSLATVEEMMLVNCRTR